MQSLATCSSDKTVRIWNTTDYTLSKTLQGHNRWVWDCVFSSASDYLVTASSDNMARLWDIKEEKSVIQYSGHHKAIVCVALNDVDYAAEKAASGSAPSSSSSASSSASSSHSSRDGGAMVGASKTSMTQQQALLHQQQQQQMAAQARLQQQQQRANETANAQRLQLINAATAGARHPPQQGQQAPQQMAPQAAAVHAKSPDDTGSAGSSPLSSGDEGSP